MFEAPQKLHPAAIIINFGVYFVATVRSLAVPLFGIFVSGRKQSGDYMTLMVGGSVALVGAISLIGTLLHFLSTRFYIEGDSLVISSGFVRRKLRTIPLARIQNVNVERTIWHRFLKAAKVKVETAAGSKSEGELTALSVENANTLQAVLLNRRNPEADVETDVKPEPLYQLSPKQVILAGALGNRAIYILGSIFAVFQVEGSHKYYRPIFNYLERLGPVTSIIAGALLFVGLIVVGWVLSIVISATRYYGFRIEKHEKGLLVTHGLVTQFKSVIPVGRIQDVRIVQPILFRLLGYSEIYADTAGSFDKNDVASANKICPILKESDTDRLGKLLLPEFVFANLDWKQVSHKTIARHASRYFVSFAIVLLLPLVYWIHWYALVAVPFIALYCWLLGVISYRFVGYAFTKDIFASRRGVFRKHVTIIPFDRVQHYTINSSLMQRWLGLASISAVSASTGGHTINISDVRIEDVDELRQTIGQAIQQHLGSRKGGL